MTAEDVRRALSLEPHPEGGFFRETFRSEHSTAIYFLITRDSFSAMHRVKQAELFHFYLGDPVEQLRLFADGTGERIVIGTDITAGMRPQAVVPGGAWQGARLVTGGMRGWALLGCTVSPPFEFAGFELANRDSLIETFPAFKDDIVRLARDS